MTGDEDPTSSAITRVFREASAQAVATLTRTFGDIGLAEDAVQDAFSIASARWAEDGMPPNPAGWIITTARRRAIDQLRRSARGRELQAELATTTIGSPSHGVAPEEPGPVSDDLLRLMFTCCHPALRTEHQVALTLRLLGGLTTEEVARSFLVSDSAMAKRLVRAKHKIKAAGIPYRVPKATDLADRLRSVLSVLYLIYNAGVDDPERADLRDEAIRLSRTLVDLLPDQSEASGLLALMLLSESRSQARDSGGDLVLLRDQDRSTWDQEMIEEGHAIVRSCIRRDRPGPYQLQAAIQAVHCAATSFEDTDWSQIVTLYDDLLSLLPTPVVALNRAIAIGEVEGADAALTAIEAIAPDLDDYHLMHATRGAQLRRLGRPTEAADAFARAAAIAPTERDRRFLLLQAAKVEEPYSPG